MGDLVHALERLARESEHIKEDARLNDRPAGPFTSAYLYLPYGDGMPAPNLFSLVRDATDAEKQPFPNLDGSSRPDGKPDRAGVHTAPHDLPALREAQNARGTPRELDAVLAAAEDVVDTIAGGTNTMVRAQREVREFAAQHQFNVQRIAEVEAAIEAAASAPIAPPEPSPPSEEEPAKMTTEEAIAAEEEAQRTLEANLARLRRQVQEREANVHSPTIQSPLKKSAPPPPSAQKTPVAKQPLFASLRASQSSARDAAPPTPSPAFATTLAQATPRRPADVSSRFSPLHLLTTPRAPLASSTLGPSLAPPSTIVARMRASITPARPRSAYRSGVLGASTSRAPPQPLASSTNLPPPLVADDTTPKRPPPAATTAPPEETPVPARSPSPSPRPDTTIDSDNPTVGMATATIRKTLPPDMFRMTRPPCDMCGETPKDVITHLISLSNADLPRPPSPSTASTADSAPTTASAADAPPVTREAVIFAHLCLLMLRRLREGKPADEANHVADADVKAELSAIAAGRGWEGSDSLANGVVYQSRGLRLLATEWRSRKLYFR